MSISTAPTSLTTERLLLRRWTDADREPFAAPNADPRVMEHYPAPLTREQSDAFVDRIGAAFDQRAYGLWAVQRKDSGQLIGYVGLWPAEFDAPFTPAVEVGWRLAAEHWGLGYASEAARAAVADGFLRLDLDEIVSFTAVPNERSWRLMERIGMQRDEAGGFEHPNVEVGHPLRRHVLYRLTREHWEALSR